jgi:hypothetical protein
MGKKPRRPRDPNQLAKLVVEIATGETQDKKEKDDPVTEFARRGGLKGGKARAEKLSPERRSEIARRAAKLRWAARSDKSN